MKDRPSTPCKEGGGERDNNPARRWSSPLALDNEPELSVHRGRIVRHEMGSGDGTCPPASWAPSTSYHRAQRTRRKRTRHGTTALAFSDCGTVHCSIHSTTLDESSRLIASGLDSCSSPLLLQPSFIGHTRTFAHNTSSTVKVAVLNRWIQSPHQPPHQKVAPRKPRVHEKIGDNGTRNKTKKRQQVTRPVLDPRKRKSASPHAEDVVCVSLICTHANSDGSSGNKVPYGK